MIDLPKSRSGLRRSPYRALNQPMIRSAGGSWRGKAMWKRLQNFNHPRRSRPTILSFSFRSSVSISVITAPNSESERLNGSRQVKRPFSYLCCLVYAFCHYKYPCSVDTRNCGLVIEGNIDQNVSINKPVHSRALNAHSRVLSRS